MGYKYNAEHKKDIPSLDLNWTQEKKQTAEQQHNKANFTSSLLSDGNDWGMDGWI